MATVITRNIDGAGSRQVVPFRKGGLQPLETTDTHVVVEFVNGANRQVQGYSIANCLPNIEAQQLAVMLNTHFARLNRKNNQNLARAGKGRKPMQLVGPADSLPPVVASQPS